MKATLGKQLAIYRGAPVRWRDLLFLFMPTSLFVLALLAYGVWRADYAYRQYGPVAAEAWSQPWFLAASVITLVLLLLSLARLVRAHRSVAIHENGISIRFSPLRARSYPWSSLAGVACASIQERFLGFTLGRRHRLALYRVRHGPLQLGNLVENSQELGEAIKSHLYPHLLPALHSSLEEGKWLNFGRLAIRKNCLRSGSRQIPWDRVSLLGVRSGYLVVESDGKTALRLPIMQITNFEVLLQLIEEGITPQT